MTDTFLHHVAKDILAKYGTNLSRIAVVFPNKRASLFLNQELVKLAGKPVWSPSYTTISQLFDQHSSLQLADPIRLICILHKVFCQCTGKRETLDQFFGWGQVLLADFDDIDKKMADAHQIFRHLENIHELDDISYLTEPQKESIRRFYGTFSELENSELRKRFLELWQRMEDIYMRFNHVLREKEIAYEGALQRDVAENSELDFRHEHYIFVGFNFLQEVEKRLFMRLKGEGKAKFYWDYDHYYISSQDKEAGTYISRNLDMFPNELGNDDENIYDNMGRHKDIRLMSAPTENIQARYIGEWVRQDGRIEAGNRSAVVLCDENLLQSVIHSLPPEVREVNITTGYPLKQTPVAALIAALIELQGTEYRKDTSRFRFRNVQIVLCHPYAKYISQEAGHLLNELKTNRRHFPTNDELCIDEGTSLLFSDITAAYPDTHLVRWMTDIMKRIATNVAEEENKDPLLQESLFRMYTLMTRLSDIIAEEKVEADSITLRRFINQLIATTAIPFHGEPALGLQIMGVLETRNLDFKHLLILSCNEGNMPKGVNDTSFIPHSIRKAYHLTTVDDKSSVYAHHFYRLIQRAEDITILYNNATDKGKTGQMSRFLLQLMVESGHNIQKFSLQAALQPTHGKPAVIKKDETILRKLGSIQTLSPTAIIKYLRCPLQFFYSYVAEIKEPDNTEPDEMDNRMFGNIFHIAAQYIYEDLCKKRKDITSEDIQYLLEAHKVEQMVDKAFQEELFSHAKGQAIRGTEMYNGLQLINRKVIIQFLEQLLQIDKRLAPFKICRLEGDVRKVYEIQTGNKIRSLTIKGIVDRMDQVNGCIRVIDYKTGSKKIEKIATLENVFDPDFFSKHSDYYLQTLLYANIVRESAVYNPERLPVAPGILQIQHTSGENYNPILPLDGKPIADVADTKEEFEQRLLHLLEEIFSPDKDFLPTDKIERCQQCSYYQLCRSKRNQQKATATSD